MTRTIALAVTPVLFALLLTPALALAQRERPDPKTLIGKPAPTFSLQTVQGKDMSLAKERGNVVVLDFWATWCPPCRESLPGLQKLHADKELADKGLKVYAVNLREGTEEAKQYLEQNNLTFPVPLDKAGAVAQKYLVSGIPTTAVVGRDGKVKAVFVGFGGGAEERLREAVNKALEEKGPATRPAAKGGDKGGDKSGEGGKADEPKE
jgi:thiol-disulfide isomerase/thioredoxin